MVFRGHDNSEGFCGVMWVGPEGLEKRIALTFQGYVILENIGAKRQAHLT